MGRNNKRPYVILIDTNVMTALTLYIDACELVKKDPSKILSIQQLKELVESRGIKKEWLVFETKIGIEHGFKAFTYLKDKAEKYELEVFFPVIAELEALHLLMERKFDEVLSKKRVPYRLRRKKFIRVQVDFDYKEVYGKWNGYKDKLENSEIILYSLEKEHNAFWTDLLIITTQLMKHILLGTVDMIIYGGSIVVGADEIYTYDTEFREIVNNIYKQPTPEWRDVAKQLCEDLKKNVQSIKEEEQSATDRGIKDYKIKLPRGTPVGRMAR